METGSSVIKGPYQLAIHTKSGNIFVTDQDTNKILVFDESGHYLYHNSNTYRTSRIPCLSDEFIFCFNSCLPLQGNSSKFSQHSFFNKKTNRMCSCGRYLSSSPSPVLPAQPTNLTVSPSPQHLSLLLLLLLVSPL